ncbi:MAG: hypothetical protein B6U95_01630 [Thermofilum sp. ex4484_82]|nr:MAG: hypothetical protein B6U95_01630 [Thermofilum sp. ex4484_82]OYT39597.1 MAG: hypothetical protein B6U96_01635 [Archaeoglobales archaeon ex4484_92]
MVETLEIQKIIKFNGEAEEYKDISILFGNKRRFLIYSTLLRIGLAASNELAKITNNTTAFVLVNLKRLYRKGLVSRLRPHGINLWMPKYDFKIYVIDEKGRHKIDLFDAADILQIFFGQNRSVAYRIYSILFDVGLGKYISLYNLAGLLRLRPFNIFPYIYELVRKGFVDVKGTICCPYCSNSVKLLTKNNNLIISCPNHGEIPLSERVVEEHIVMVEKEYRKLLDIDIEWIEKVRRGSEKSYLLASDNSPLITLSDIEKTHHKLPQPLFKFLRGIGGAFIKRITELSSSKEILIALKKLIEIEVRKIERPIQEFIEKYLERVIYAEGAAS